MAQTFHITPAANFATLDATGTGKIAFTITNASTRPMRAWPEIKPLGSTRGEWLTIEGQAERSFSPNEAHVFTVLINPPGTALPGKYEFKVNVINADKAALDACTEGPSVQFEVLQKEAPPPPTSKWVWIAAAVLVLLIGGAVAVAVWPNENVAVPNIEGKQLADVQAAIQESGLVIAVQESRITQDGSKPAGYVWNQDPKADAPLKKGDSIKVVVEAASVPVPTLTGGSLANALRQANALNLRLNNPTARVDPANLDKVVDQNPKPNVRVAEATPIDIVLGTSEARINPLIIGILKDQISVREMKAKAEVKTFGDLRVRDHR